MIYNYVRRLECFSAVLHHCEASFKHGYLIGKSAVGRMTYMIIINLIYIALTSANMKCIGCCPPTREYNTRAHPHGHSDTSNKY